MYNKAHLKALLSIAKIFCNGLVTYCFFCVTTAGAAEPIYKLKTSGSVLTINERGVIDLNEKDKGERYMHSTPQNWWHLELWSPTHTTKLGKSIIIGADHQRPKIQLIQNKIKLFYSSLKNGSTVYKLSLEVTIEVKDDAYVFSGEVNNKEEGFTVRSITLPELTGINNAVKKYVLYWPNGLGERFKDSSALTDRTLEYPSGKATMQWFTLNNGSGGLYIGSHDSEELKKSFSLSYNQQKHTYSAALTQYPFCEARQSATLVPFILKPYRGSWYEAAKTYSLWFNAHTVKPLVPDWVTHNSGWLLSILKQQNGEALWKYNDIIKLYQIADKNGLDVVGLFGWGTGGHDQLYPNYIADSLLGGKAVLMAALKKAVQYHKKTIMYANGQLIDAATDFYRSHGNEVIAYSEILEPEDLRVMRKFYDYTPVTFAKGCSGSELWRKTMLELALQAHDLGANGILFDQLGVIDAPPCYNTGHLHKNPATAFTTERYSMLKEIVDHMHQIDPDFVVMTEGIIDVLQNSVVYNHGWGEGFAANSTNKNSFPALYRYTFPEQIITQRHGTPMQDRSVANYACLYGLRHEIESRYSADVKYLTDGIVPKIQDYQHVVNPPEIKMMQQRSIGESQAYLHGIIDFERNNEQFFINGIFVDEDGIVNKDTGLQAKGFKNGKQLGVVVCNNNSVSKMMDIMIPGYHLEEIKRPEKGEGMVIAPQSICLMIWIKN
ncbi:MAG: DUF6259 domain-containing protein [Mucilaginibacter sp.]|uniref:DUF6259 domain-containing protein n=1 Tax=Mucilaginibacter sp. TaxID=1882438 RepID=UPI00326433C4